MNIAIALLLLVVNTVTPTQYNTKKTFKKDQRSIIVSVEIIPTNGWKWNESYPSRFSINLLPNVKLVKKDVIHSDKRLRFIFEIQGQIKPIKELTIDGTFSLCTKAVCRIWRRERFRIREKNELKNI